MDEVEEMAIPSDLCEAVAFLCEERAVRGTPGRVPVATAFFVVVPFGNDTTFVYLVTARHCIEDSQGGKLHIRVNRRVSGFHDIPTDQGAWSMHQDGDVAATLFCPDLSRYPDLEYRTIPLWSFVGPGYTYTGPPLPPTAAGLRVALGHEVYFVGLFTQHYGVDRNLPILRFGHISRMPDNLRLPRNRGASSFQTLAYLVETHSWGGHSGSPAFFMYPMTAQRPMTNEKGEQGTMIVIGNCVAFLGLVSAHYDIPTAADTTGDILGTIQTKLNSGIAVVTPADRVMELSMRKDFQEDREHKKQETHRS